jgi:hypothetical protein
MSDSELPGWPTWAVIAALALVYLTIMRFNPARSSLRNGARCVARYRQIWGVLAILGIAYAGWQTGLHLALHYFLLEDRQSNLQWYRAWALTQEDHIAILRSAFLPALEGVAGIFNCVITTFPLASLAALLLILNSGGHFGILRRALRKKFGRSGWILFGFITLCALAAIMKPWLYVLLPVSSRYLNGLDAVRIAFTIDWLAFTFEYLFGVLIQIYLILLAYIWIRGLNFSRQHLVDVAIRRFSYVLKWSCVVLLISSLTIDLPRVLSIIPPFSEYLHYPVVMNYITTIARPGLAVFLILFASVQITLAFHSEHLRSALRDHGHFLARSIWQFGWFFLVAFIHFYLLHIGNDSVVRGFGEGNIIVIVWNCIYPVIGAWVAGWLLASWVCLFKAFETGHAKFQEMVRF